MTAGDCPINAPGRLVSGHMEDRDGVKLHGVDGGVLWAVWADSARWPAAGKGRGLHMEMKGKAERLRLLHERGRLGRGMRHGGVRYWIGHHRQLGLLIFDPHAQREVETGKVRLFSVTEHESRLFMLNMARTRPLWSSPDDHLEEMRKAVIEYGRARERQRETHCHWCRRDINSLDFSLCIRCRWIRCACGHCGCRYRGQQAACGDQDRGGSSARSAPTAEGRKLP